MTTQFIRMPNVQRLTGLSRSSIYNRISDSAYGDPDFPRSIPLSPSGRGAVAWDIAEIECWMAKKAEARE